MSYTKIFEQGGLLSEGMRKQVFIAALAGMAASIPMAFVMQGLLKLLPKREQYALPPEEITVKVASSIQADPLVDEKPARRVTTWLAHLGYGAATASLYPMATNRLNWPPVLRGMIFAIGVWSASYLGWLPAARIMPPATEQPTRRNALMIVAHLVWGAIIGIIVHTMEE
jgi:uncharacterized membrane protein YagU involved in acid resistance